MLFRASRFPDGLFLLEFFLEPLGVVADVAFHLVAEALAALVWETLIDSARDDMGYDKTLFELLRTTLY